MNKIAVILNPAARGEKAKSMGDKIKRMAHGSSFFLSPARGHTRLLARKAVEDGYKTIVAAGGDGTINEVVNGIAGADVALGILPVGTMNVFAAELGLPANNLRECWELIEDGHCRKVDLPRANRQYFVQLAGVGLDAQVVKETSWNFRKNFGPLSYVISATQIAARKPPRLVVDAGGELREGSFVLIGNGRFYGGPFTIFKNARIDDGKLDVLIFKNLGYLDIVRYLNAIVFGTHASLSDVEYFQTEKATIRSEQEVPIEVDGELMGNLPVSFRFSPRKLKVISPAV